MDVLSDVNCIIFQKEDDAQISFSSAEMPASEDVPEMNGNDHHIPESSFSCLVKVEHCTFCMK